jgi:transposase InsO family protein
MMRADGLEVSASTVERALRRRGLLLPRGFRADRKSWAAPRRKVFHDPPTERNRGLADRLQRVRDSGRWDLAHLRRHRLRHQRTRVRSPQTNGVIERFFGTLKYEHLDRAPIDDGGALAMETARFRDIYNRIRPHQALDDRTPRQAYLAT